MGYKQKSDNKQLWTFYAVSGDGIKTHNILIMSILLFFLISRDKKLIFFCFRGNYVRLVSDVKKTFWVKLICLSSAIFLSV